MVQRRKKTIQQPKGKEKVIVNQLIVKAPQRRVVDVGHWRTALRSADNGRVKQLYDLFDDVLIDGVLSDAIQKRIDAVANSELTFLDASGKEVDVIADIMDTTDWETLITEIMKRKFYGRSAAEITFNEGFRVAPIPAKHINLTNKSILREDSEEIGIPYEGDPHLLVLGGERDFGLLLKATPYAIYKRGGFGDWSQWVELFGMPQRIGKYNTYDPESRKLLTDALENAGSAPYLVIPKESDVETKESGSGNGNSYNEFRHANNEEMLITILGQTMTTVQGEKGARSLGEVHKEVEEGKNKSDLRYVQRILNQYLVPLLESRGYPVAGGWFVFPKAAEALSVTDIVQLSDIMEIPQSYLHEKYSIPVPKDGELIAKRAQQPSQIDMEEIDNVEDEEVNEKTKNLNQSDRKFYMRLWDFFVKASRVGASNGIAPIKLNDEGTLDERLINSVASRESTYFNAELYEYFVKDLLNAIQKGLKQGIKNVDYGYNMNDDAFKVALEQNLFHFSASKTLAEVQQLNSLFNESKNFEEFSNQAKTVCDTFNKAWQKAEYDTAVLAAESAANYRDLMRKKHIYPYWRYVTVGDNSVREEHEKLDGVTLINTDPRWDKIFPLNGWRCRCRVVGVMRKDITQETIAESEQKADNYMQTDEWKMVEAQHWDTNRGKNAEIFNKNQMYVRKFPQMAASHMEKVTPEKWGLERSMEKCMGQSKEATTPYEGEAQTWWDIHKTRVNGTEQLKVTDYAKRSWYMQKKEFDDHCTNKKKKREFRKDYLNCIQEVMTKPDEVWLGQEVKDANNPESRLNNWIYIKYYQDVTLACVCKLQGDKMVFKSWYELKDKRVRSGFLVRGR